MRFTRIQGSIPATCALLAFTGAARALTIDVDTTIDATSVYQYYDAIVGQYSAGPTVTIVEGANRLYPLQAYNASVINIVGGQAGAI